MTHINASSPTTSAPAPSTSSNPEENVCRPDDNSTSTSTSTSDATGVTATQDSYEGAKNASSITSTGANALALRNSGLIKVLGKADDAAGAQSVLKKYNKGLAVVGAGATAINQGLNSDATTTTGKVVNGVAAGGISLAASKLHPGVAIADLATGGAVSQNLNNGVNATVTIVDGLATGNTDGMESLHRKNMEGQNGAAARKAAEAGEFWADKGVSGGLSEFGDAVGYFFTGK
jgi:hypothetical protein